VIASDHDPEGVELVRRWYAEGMNGKQATIIPEIFSAAFVSHQPFCIPGIFNPHLAGSSSDHLRELVSFLSSPTVDLSFSLEDTFGSGDRIAYRLFGEGTVRVFNGSKISSIASELNVPRYDYGRLKWIQPHVRGSTLGDRCHMIFGSIGIFRVSGKHLAEHWERMFIE